MLKSRFQTFSLTKFVDQANQFGGVHRPYQLNNSTSKHSFEEEFLNNANLPNKVY
jgi:hypothetical protein